MVTEINGALWYSYSELKKDLVIYQMRQWNKASFFSDKNPIPDFLDYKGKNQFRFYIKYRKFPRF